MAKITKKENLGIKEVFDISMDGEPNFVAEGIVLHNCDLSSRELLVGADGKSGFLYGRWGDKAAQISTRSMLRLKSAIKDVDRALHGEVRKDIEFFTKNLPAAPQGVSDQEYVFGYEDSDGNAVAGLLERDDSLKEYVANNPKEWDIVTKALGITRSFGQHACFSGHTLLDDNGKVSCIKNASFVGNKPISVWSSGVRDTVLVCFNNGIVIKCTPDHVFITTKGEVCAKDLVGESVLFKPFSKTNGNDELDDDMLFALGWGLNDGSFNKKHTNQVFYFTPQKDDTARERVTRFLDGLGVTYWGIKSRKDSVYCGTVNLPNLFFESGRNKDQRLPFYFWNLTFRAQCVFMKGFMSANGYVLSTRPFVGFKVASKLLGSDICVWLTSNGMSTCATFTGPSSGSIKGREIKSSGSTTICLSGHESKKIFLDNVGFIQPYKQKRLEEIALKRKKYDHSTSCIKNFASCARVEGADQEEVFDFNEPIDNTGHINGMLAHNSAFVISDSPIALTTPVFMDTVTQYEAKFVEKSGLIKYDFLVVNHLKDIEKCVQLISDKNGEKLSAGRFRHNGIETYVWDLPEDPAVFESVHQGDTETVFQLHTAAMIPFTKKIAPRNIDDLSVILALVRPGPLDFKDPVTGLTMADEYVERRNGRGSKPIAAVYDLIPETYGVMCYQEQVAKVAKNIGKMDPIDAENLRRAFGKKEKKKVDGFKPKFIAGATESVGKDLAETIWAQMETSSRYSFNKSHSTSYAMISYTCMFLRHHYPLEWWTAILSNADEKEISEKYFNKVRELVAPPDINLSTDEMRIDYKNNKIISKLTVLRGVGEQTIAPIVANRPYQDVRDFVNKEVAAPSLTKKLIVAGVMDSLFEPKLPLQDKVLQYEIAVANRDYDKKVSEGKKPKPPVVKIDTEYVNAHPLKIFQKQKEILATMPLMLSEVLLKAAPTETEKDREAFLLKMGAKARESKSKKKDKEFEVPMNEGKDTAYFADSHGITHKFLSGNQFQVMEAKEDGGKIESISFCVAAYVVDCKEFYYSGNTRKAVKMIVDIDGVLSERVMWPDYESGSLTYPNQTSKGSIVLLFMERQFKQEPKKSNKWGQSGWQTKARPARTNLKEIMLILE